MSKGWIGVDLDGTLAYYDGWNGVESIGDPIPSMLARVVAWREAGKDVRVFTARVSEVEAIPHIEAWLERNGLGGMQITNVKDFGLYELWDDRAVRVIPNTGEPCCSFEHGGFSK